MKRAFSLSTRQDLPLVVAGTGFIAATYGLVRLAYGLFLPDVRAEFGFGASMAGLISSGASIVYCLGALLGFFFAADLPRVLVLVAAGSAGLGALGMAAAPTTAVFGALAVISSLGAGLASPTLVTIVRRSVSPSAIDRAQMIINAGTGPGLAAAGLLALVLLPDWRLAWGLVGIFTAVIAALVLAFDRGSREPGETARALPPRSWFAGHGRLVAGTLLLGAGSAAVWTYGRTVLVDAGVSDTLSVAAWVALGLGGAAVITTAAWMGARSPRTAWTISVLAVVAATAALGAVPEAIGVAAAACAAFGWGFVAATGALIAWTTELDAPRAPTGTALLFVVLVLGQALGSSAIGALIETAGGLPAFLAAAGVTLAAVAVTYAPDRVSVRS